MGRAVHLHVVGEGAGEAHVAAAEQQLAVGQLQFAQQALYVLHHVVQRGVAVLGLFHAHDLHLVELVHAVEPAYMGTVAAGLTAETGRVAHQFHGQLVRIHDLVAVQVGDGHFGRGDQVEVVHRGVVHLALLVGQLAGGEGASGVHHVRRNDLAVSGGRGAVQEEGDERPLQLGALPAIHREPGPGDLHAEVHVQEAVFLAQLPMGLGSGMQYGDLALLHHGHVLLRRAANGHQGIGCVGNGAEVVVKCFLRGLQAFAEFLAGRFQGGGAAFGGFCLVLLASLHQVANGAAQSVQFGKLTIQFGLRGAAHFIQFQGAVQQPLGVDVAFGQALFGLVTVRAQKGQFQHGVRSVLKG